MNIRDGKKIATEFEATGRKAALRVLVFPSITNAKRYVRKMGLKVVCGKIPLCSRTTFAPMQCPRENPHADAN